MNVTKETLEKSQIKLTVEISLEEMAPYIKKAARRVSENLNIPGFRKGQAPLDVVSKKIGEMELLQNAAELAVQVTLPQAIKDNDLETVGQPSINLEKLAPENLFIYTAILPLLPEITLGNVANLKVSKEKTEVKEEDIDKVISNLQKMRAKESLVDRPAKKGDKTEINFKVFLDNVPVDGGSGDKYPLVLGEETMIPGFEENMVGMKKDEEKEFTLTFPGDYHNKQLAGKTCDFKVKLLSVFEVSLPELDVDFAGQIGDFDSMDALKDSVEKNLHEEKQTKAEGEFERKVIEAMIEASKFGDIPEVMVTAEARTMMQELEQNIARQGLKFEEYLAHLKKDRGQLMLDFTPDAVKRIKSALIIKALAKQENIVPSEEDVKEELDTLRHMYQGNKEVITQMESKPYQEYMKNIVRNKKTIHWLKEAVQKN